MRKPNDKTRWKQDDFEKADSRARAYAIENAIRNPKGIIQVYETLLKCNKDAPVSSAFALSIFKALAKRYDIKGN